MAEDTVITELNRQLRDNYGIDSFTSLAMYRVIWSTGVTEKRKTKFTDTGIELLLPIVRECLKYPHDQDFYILERLTVVPDVNADDIPEAKLSYEPLWIFRMENGMPIRPTYRACAFCIDMVRAAMGKQSAAKYKNEDDPNAPITNKHEAYEHNKKRLQEIENELYGDEADLRVSESKGNAAVVPSNYKRTIQ